VNKKGDNSFLLDSRIDAPIKLNPKIPLALSNLVMEMISTRKDKRPVDMDAVISRLELSKHVLLKQTGAVQSPIIPDSSDSSTSAAIVE
jgi:hypothetical protein